METLFNDFRKSAGLSEWLKDPSYATRYAACVQSLENLSATELRNKYPAEYSSWKDGKYRAKRYNKYWHPDMDPFNGFLAINGPIPHEKWTLDRINPRGAYEPSNIRWADKETQSQNRTNSLSITLEGEQWTVNALSEVTGKTPHALRMGIRRTGDAYVEKLVPLVAQSKLNDSVGAIHLEIEQWNWPDDTNPQVLNDLYGGRIKEQMKKPTFFAALVSYEIFLREEISASDPIEAHRIEAQNDIDRLRPLLVDTQTFIDDINQRIDALHPRQPDPEDYYLNLIGEKVKDHPCKTKPINPVMVLFPQQPQPPFARDFLVRYAALKTRLQAAIPSFHLQLIPG